MTSALPRFFLAAVVAALSFTALAAPKPVRVHLEGIADGDTIYVRNVDERASYRVRLATSKCN